MRCTPTTPPSRPRYRSSCCPTGPPPVVDAAAAPPPAPPPVVDAADAPPPASPPAVAIVAAAAAPPPFLPPVSAAKPRAKPKKRVREPTPPPPKEDSTSSSSESDNDGNDSEGSEGVVGKGVTKTRQKPIPRIKQDERVCVENWIQKCRKDGKMLNARWIRNGGAKGQSMTATSGEVKTSGAYEALALYVNKSLQYTITNPRVWSNDISKKRWTSLYKSFKEALLLGSKGNSAAGCTLAEIQTNTTSLLAKQKAKCASFEVLLKLYDKHPSVKPIKPMEIGSIANDSKNEEGVDAAAGGLDVSAAISESTIPAALSAVDVSSGVVPAPAVPAPAVPVPPAVGAAAAAAAGGKAAAPFSMKPSKHVKMDLGEAYLLAQSARTALLASQQAAKNKADMIVELSKQGKSASEIADLLQLLF